MIGRRNLNLGDPSSNRPQQVLSTLHNVHTYQPVPALVHHVITWGWADKQAAREEGFAPGLVDYLSVRIWSLLEGSCHAQSIP